MTEMEYQQSNENKTIEELMKEADLLIASMIRATKRIINKLRPLAKRVAAGIEPMGVTTYFPFEYNKNASYGQKGDIQSHFLHWAWTREIQAEVAGDKLLRDIEPILYKEETI